MIREVFEYPAGGKDISLQLMELRQGSDSAMDYAIKFRTLAAQSGWNDAVLWAVFCEGLSPVLQTELACREDATSLSQYVATAIRLDNLLLQHRAGAHSPVSSRPRPDYPRPREEARKPMQLGRSRLTEWEHQRHTQMRLCYYCGGSGHLIHQCCEKPSPAQGTGGGVPDPHYSLYSIDSQTIGGGSLTHQTKLLDFKVGLFHREHLAFYVTSSPANPVILGFPWLRQHDPQISWHKGKLVRWSVRCLIKCLHEPVSRPCLSPVVESRKRAAHLPAHRPWDCAIDLLPNTSPPKGRVYPLSLPEARAMEEYIEEALALGHIRPSTSPAAAGFFFMGKKDGGLRPCIDYRGLNTITVPYNLVKIREGDKWKTAFHTTHGHYEYLIMPFGLTNAPAVFQSLINEVFQDILGKWVIAYIDDILVYSTSLEEHVHHVQAVLSRLQQNHLYIKPEKCEFHRTTITFLGYVISQQGVEMNLTKVHVVTEWPNPTMIKELQQFLGFANFYRRFIRNYSSVASPLTSLLQGKPRRLSWSDQAQVTCVKLKDSFTTAIILRHPDPDLPFVVEVDASSSGIGAMLS
ncbi:hypothetical protein QTP70_029425 [Hemibagrus guttatus]|uniref:ribonuclease H n=1 Tax=Hemibagrus guttatus TaxID=175788 RepID=A0AAE0UJR0_9TELE|nr:hypothetical protein QTP70_029425 [Hemibagrus guttatus]